MRFTNIGLRDVLTAAALATSVTALATNGPPALGLRSAEAESRLSVPADGDPRPWERDAGRRDRRFGRVEASEFVVVDDDGRDRATIGVDGGGVLRFRAGNDETPEAFVLSVFPDGRTAFLLKDDRGRNRLTLATAEDGRPFLSMTERGALTLEDERAQNRLVLRVAEDGRPSIVVDDRPVR